MSLPIPNLDDRNFEDLMKEARSLIPIYNKEWTNYNPSDTGITLIELFAWLSEMVIYRVNRVPEENYRKFLKLIGIELEATGTGTLTSKDKIVTGEGTVFTKELKKGDSITVDGQTRFVTAVDSDISLAVDFAFEPAFTAGKKFAHSSAGTGTISSKGKIVTGEGTKFTEELKKGDSITAIVKGEFQTRFVTSVNSDTSLTVDSAFDPELQGTNFTHSYESIDSGIRRGLESISRRYRAITSDDFEFLAKECMEALQKGLAVRAICMNNRDLENSKGIKTLQPGHVSVIIIPRCTEKSDYCEEDGLPTDKLKSKVRDYLDVRRLITTRVHVVEPDYRKVKEEVWIALKKNTVEENVKDEAIASMKRYFDPLEGGQDGKGWLLGRGIYRSEIYHLLERIPGVDHVVKIKINGSEANLMIEEYQLVSLEPVVEVYHE